VLGYAKATGDWFAIIAPVGIMLGRVGCMLHGCCLGRACEANWLTVSDSAGVARWPASQVEFVFNAFALGGALLLRWRRIYPNQHFHLYLIGYGLFRFAHEFFRDTPRWGGGISGYQVFAGMLVGLGVVFFLKRRQTK
jgi:phosphatidylglycerol:prolipoprotein diacylglycerol transferase